MGASLYFNGRTVIAKADGVTLELSSMPAIDALPKNTTEILFSTDLCQYELRQNGHPRRPMQAPEIEALVRLLRRISDFGCGLFRRQT